MMPFLTALTLLAPASAAGGATGTYGLTFRPDYVDPALSYTLEGWSILATTHTPLLTYEHVDGPGGTRLVPGLAEAMPEVSADGLTYTLRLREGLRYSNGREVRARDFEHTVKRILTLESGGSAFYLGIRGAERYVRRRRARADISGIVTDDASRTIRIDLTEPDGSFPYVLAMQFAGVVPAGTPFQNLSRRPPPGVGPFRIVRSGRRALLLRKDPAFAIPGIPQAALDAITVRYGARHGTVDIHLDPPPRRLRTGDRYFERDTLTSFYFFLNHRLAPFDDPQVRKAVNFALDKPALKFRFGDLFTPGCTFLPPGVPGYEQRECPYGDPNAGPQLDRAREMIRAAGAAGARVTVYGHDEPPGRGLTIDFANTLRAIGLRPRLRIVEASVYFTTIGNQRTRAQAGFANWFADFPHPRNFLFLVDGDTIQRTNNQNFGNVDDGVLNDLLDRVNVAPIDEVAPLAAEADRRIVDEALVAPFGYRKLAFLFSARVPPECRALHLLYSVDLARLCVTG
jgi:peptide/nickel transport system substrate-binding protein